MWLIQVNSYANGTACDYKGHFLKEFNVDAMNGRGHASFTKTVEDAKKFATHEDAVKAWRTQSKVRPWRPDGQPNRPLTAYTVEVFEHE